MKTTHHSPLTTHASPHGVVLIVVLGMLAVLALIGVAFLTFSAEEEQSSSRYQVAFQTPRADMAADLLFLEAINQLILDTHNQLSALHGHGLLPDMYGQGSDYFTGPDGRPGVAWQDTNGNGVPDAGEPGDDNSNGTWDEVGELGWPGSDDRNGVLNSIEWYSGAFSGPGDRGLYQPVHSGPDGILGTADDCFDVNFVWNRRVPNTTVGAMAGGFNEDYDYPDRQNMFLALLRADGTVIVPSFHRPGVGAPVDTDLSAPLVTGRTAPLLYTEADQRARVKLLRPRGGTGTENPNFPVLTDLLDVDNNGDGIRDSVWIDLGLPVQQTANGRKFKALFAFLVVDGDGKLNLNAHGNVANVLLTPSGHADFDTSGNVLGQGYSPGEVALQNIFKDLTALPTYAVLASVGPNEYNWLLTGRPAGGGPTSPVAGRYGETIQIGTPAPPRAGKTHTDPAVTSPGSAYGPPPTPTAGVAPAVGDDDSPRTLGTPPYWSYPLRGNWQEGMRGVFVNFGMHPTKIGRYGTPPDFNGDGALGVDPFGRFIYFASGTRMGWGGVAPLWPDSMIYTGHSENFDNVDDQSEVDLYTARPNDGTFQPSDMEFLYRYSDVDSSSLLSRLRWLTPSLAPNPDTLDAARRRMTTTTESWDLIRYNMFPLTQNVAPTLPNETEFGIYRPRGSGKFNTNGLRGVTTAAQFTNTPGLVPEPSVLAPGSNLFGLQPGLPVEIARGRRLNLNRGFFGSVSASAAVTSSADPRTIARDIYIMLRQLYVVDPTTIAGATACEQMAQYAVNLVDFRDPDQIMTGFEFVYDLGAGWIVDGNLSTNEGGNRGLVWGVEAPQVLINETYAIEDPSAVGAPQLWFELYNPQHLDPIDNAFQANLQGPGPNSAYQAVLADTSPGVPGGLAPVGEPSSTLRRLEFTPMPAAPAVGGTGAKTVDPNAFFLIGPSTVAGNPLTPPPSFDVPEGTFSPTVAEIGSTIRLYLRRLADPTAAHNAGPDTIDGTADDVNPYLTVDALDVQVYSETDVNPPMAMPPTHRSLERVVPYSVKRAFHTAGSASPHTLTTLNEQSSLNTAVPYAPLPFNDRPFASAMEMLLVPAVRPQWLTSTFVVPASAFSPYNPGANRSLPIRTGDSGGVNAATPFIDAPYFLAGHLFNFFREVSTGLQPYPNPGLYRILEFVEVPSRMNGSTDPTIGPLAGDNRLDRVPGKMNINTAIAEQEQFLAMFNNHPLALGGVGALPVPPGTPARVLPAPGTSASTPVQLGFPCRSGSTQPTSELLRRCLDSMLGPDGVMGTADDLPFRSLGVGTATISPPQMIQPTDIHNTLLRSWPTVGGFPSPTATTPRTTADLPLFFDSRVVSPPGSPGAPNLLGYPNFQNQPIEKISNIATTRSNVYAVWITVGFFEVLNEAPNRLSSFGVDNAPPELGAEINADVGQNVRHRAFFIIDRSRARGYLGPPRSSEELQDILSQVVIHSRIME